MVFVSCFMAPAKEYKGAFLISIHLTSTCGNILSIQAGLILIVFAFLLSYCQCSCIFQMGVNYFIKYFCFWCTKVYRKYCGEGRLEKMEIEKSTQGFLLCKMEVE